MSENTASQTGAAVRFERVTKIYPGKTAAVRELSLEIPRGQFCVLLGVSGAGKSTLLRMVNGLEAATEGQVLVDGNPAGSRGWRALRRRVGTIHQQFNLVPRSTVLENVLNGALPETPLWRSLLRRFSPEHCRRAYRLVERVGLGEEHLFRRASALSGGQQQRVGIARAFLLKPSLVLADEPVASLDPQTSRDVLALLREASREHGCTVLCSLHQIELAREFGDRIVGLCGGRVVFDGGPYGLDDRALEVIYGRNSALRNGKICHAC